MSVYSGNILRLGVRVVGRLLNFAFFASLSLGVFAQEPESLQAGRLGWDLSYKRLFEINKLAQTDVLVSAFGRNEASKMPIFSQ